MKLFNLAAVALLMVGSAVAAEPAKPAVAARPKPANPVTPATPALPPAPFVDPAAIDSALKSLIDSQKVIGVSALVYERGQEVYFGAFGLADRENNKPMTRETVVQIFSMTKPVTGVALMQLYERGKFELDAPLSRYLPEFADVRVYAGLDAGGQPKYEPPKRPISVRDILRHTAGFHGDGSPEAVTAIYRQVAARDFNLALPDVSARLAQVPLSYQPGTQWKYSDVVDVQAYLVQKLSGVPFDEYLKLHILRPLGMTSTRHTILPTDPDRPQLAALYTRNDDGTFTRQTDEEAYTFNSAAWPYKPGSFGLVSTIDDYMKFARMLLGGGKLGRARILTAGNREADGHRRHAERGHRKILAAGQGAGGLRHRLRGAHRAAERCAGTLGRSRRVLLGRSGEHIVLGGPEERHRRGAVHADAAVRQGWAA